MTGAQRSRKWYRKNLDLAREVGRYNAKKYRERHPQKAADSNERCRAKRGKRNKAFIDAYKSFFGCRRCYESEPVVLDMHHRDPIQKEFKVSDWLYRASLGALAKELEKCEVLCANDHRREHAQ